MTDIRKLQENFERWTKDEPILKEDINTKSYLNGLLVLSKKMLEDAREMKMLAENMGDSNSAQEIEKVRGMLKGLDTHFTELRKRA